MCANYTTRLQAWMEKNPKGTIGSIYDRFLGELTIRQVCHVLDGMERDGRIRLGQGGNYEYRAKPHHTHDKQMRIWAVIRSMSLVGPVSSVVEVARLAEASADYTKRYIRFLVKSGHLEKTAKGYRPDLEAPLEAPRWTRRMEERKARQ